MGCAVSLNNPHVKPLVLSEVKLHVKDMDKFQVARVLNRHLVVENNCFIVEHLGSDRSLTYSVSLYFLEEETIV